MASLYFDGLTGLEQFLAEQLARVSRRCAANACLTIFVFVVVCGVMIGGFALVESENRTSRLWIDQNSAPKNNLDYTQEFFEEEARFNSYFVTALDDTQNALTKAIVERVFEIHDTLLSANFGNGSYVYDDICLQDSDGCIFEGALGFWDYNSTLFRETVSTDADVAIAMNGLTFLNGDAVVRETIFGGFQSNGTAATAVAFWMTYLVRGEVDGSDALPKAWEKLFLDFTLNETQVNVYPLAERSIDDELGRSATNDSLLLAIAFTIMIAFSANVLGKPCSALYGRSLVANADILSIALSGAAGYGFCFYIGIPFNALVQILPFLLLGIGIDNAFVLASAFDATDDSLDPVERVYLAVRATGMSVTATSLTDFLALILGSTTRLPAVEYFCIYASISILFIYLMHITAFMAFLKLDADRVAARRADIAVCIKIKEENVTPKRQDGCKDAIRYFFYEIYGPFILGDKMRYVILVVFAAIFGLGIYGATTVGLFFQLEDLAPDDSYLRVAFDKQNELFGSVFTNLPTGLYFKEVSYWTDETQVEMERLTQELLDSETIDETLPVTSWHREFTQFVQTNPLYNSSLSPNGYFVQPSSEAFVLAVLDFVSQPQFSRFFNDIAFDANFTRILASRIQMFHVVLPDSITSIDALLITEGIAARSSIEPEPFVVSPPYVYFHQYAIILPEMLQNFALVLVAILIVCVIMLVHPIAIVIITITILMILTSLVGSLKVWGLDLNSITVINLVMAIGLVVDYSLHIIHNFVHMQPKALPRKERTLRTLRDMGGAVFLGLFTTFLGVLPVAFANSAVFRAFFYQFISIVFVGGIHGFIFLPVALSMFGPEWNSPYVNKDDVKGVPHTDS